MKIAKDGEFAFQLNSTIYLVQGGKIQFEKQIIKSLRVLTN